MIGWALETFVSVNLLILLVLLVRRPAASLFGAGWAYALWLLPVLRMVMPPLPAMDVAASLPAIVVVPAIAAATPSPSSRGIEQWVPLMLALWALGAILFVLWQFASYQGFLKRLGGSIRPGYPEHYDGVALYESRAVEGPLAIGLLDPRIIVPIDFLSRYTPAEQRLALAHERVHHRRGDLWWNGLAMLVLALNWFNPLAWIAFRAFRADQELACDADVACRAAPAERHDYATALVKSASQTALIAACPLHSADQLKRRLKMMNQHRSSRLRRTFGSAALLSLFAAGLGISAPTYAQEEVKEEKVVKKVVIKHVGKDGKEAVLEGRDLSELRAKCEDGKKAESDVSSGDDKKKIRTHVVICGGDASDPQTRERLIAALEKARTELGTDGEMGAEHRRQALEALDREIARIRSEGAK